jgi:hypothetical protein
VYRHDSTHFGFHRSNVEVTKTSCGKLSVNGKLIHVFTERDPKVRGVMFCLACRCLYVRKMSFIIFYAAAAVQLSPTFYLLLSVLMMLFLYITAAVVYLSKAKVHHELIKQFWILFG